jgi:hypothetical protein
MAIRVSEVRKLLRSLSDDAIVHSSEEGIRLTNADGSGERTAS